MNYGEVYGSWSKKYIKEIKGHNSLDISDIDGSKPGSLLKTQFKPLNRQMRDNMNINDIDGAHSGTKNYIKRIGWNGNIIDNYEKLVNNSKF